MADGNMERYENPDAIETKASRLNKLEGNTEFLLDEAARVEDGVRERAELLKNDLDDLKALLNPEESKAFQDRITDVDRKIKDILDNNALNENMPPLFKEIYSFNTDTRVFYIQGQPILTFTPGEMPVRFLQSPSLGLTVDYRDESSGKRTSTEFSHEYSRKGNSSYISHVTNVEFDVDQAVSGLSQTELFERTFERAVDSFRLTGNFDADLTELNRLYSEISSIAQGDPSLVALGVKYQELAQRYPDKMKNLPSVEKAELMRRQAYSDLVYLDNNFVYISGRLAFSNEAAFRDFLDKTEECFKGYEESFNLFKKVDSDFARTQMSKIIRSIQVLDKKLNSISPEQIDISGVKKLQARIAAFHNNQ